MHPSNNPPPSEAPRLSLDDCRDGMRVRIVGNAHTHSFPSSAPFVGAVGTIVDRDGCMLFVRLDAPPIGGARHYWAWADELVALPKVTK